MPVYVRPLPIIHCAVVPAFSVASAAAYLPLMVAFGPPMIRPLVPPVAQTAHSATCHPVGCADALVRQTVVVSADTLVGVPLLLMSSLVSLIPVGVALGVGVPAPVMVKRRDPIAWSTSVGLNCRFRRCTVMVCVVLLMSKVALAFSA